MSQENSNSINSGETRKKILLGVLFVIFAGIVYLQFFTGGETPSKSSPPAAGTGASAVVKPAPQPTPRPGGSPEPIISQPLDLASMSSRAAAGGGTGRNIFVYPPPPTPTPAKPVPTPPPPPPPPLTAYSVNPSGVIARTGEFNLTIFGEKFPSDSRVYIEGREVPTTFVSANEVKAKVSAETIGRASNLGVQVRSQTNAALYSNQITLNVAEPPAPPYRFIGLIVSKKGTIAVLKSQTDDEVINVVKGQKFKNWRVINITSQRIEVEDTNIKVSHVINFSGENG